MTFLLAFLTKGIRFPPTFEGGMSKLLAIGTRWKSLLCLWLVLLASIGLLMLNIVVVMSTGSKTILVTLCLVLVLYKESIFK